MTVIGPITEEDFRYMGLLKGSLRGYFSSENPEEYRSAINKERILLKEELQRIVGKEVAF
jgi:hypothetical protein